MAHLHYFFIPDGLEKANPSNIISLPSEEAHHALRVVRIRNDDIVSLFDGQGHWSRGRFCASGKREAEVIIEESGFDQRDQPAITLIQANLQRDQSMEDIIRHATELGVYKVVFFDAARSVRTKKNRMEKWHRYAVEACKQCGRAWLPEIVYEDTLQAALRHTNEISLALLLNAKPLPVSEILTPSKAVSLIVGPEGDFNPEEYTLLDTHSKPVSLGNYIYRSEVASILGITILQYLAGRLGPI